MEAKTIDEVLQRLDKIIADSVMQNSNAGIFAYIYRRTTAQIRQAILDKQFDDNERMERFDVHFANKYLEAYDQYLKDGNCSRPWKTAFSTMNDRLTILQHILLGMNAHINYDLGLTAYEMAPSTGIETLKADFMKVNDVLNGLTDEMQSRLGRVSPLMFLLDWVGQNSDEQMIDFSMIKAREQAWNFATVLYSGDETSRVQTNDEVVTVIANLAEKVSNPPGRILKFILRFISRFEVKNIEKIITNLSRER
jgi:hypothetical protein